MKSLWKVVVVVAAVAVMQTVGTGKAEAKAVSVNPTPSATTLPPPCPQGQICAAPITDASGNIKGHDWTVAFDFLTEGTTLVSTSIELSALIDSVATPVMFYTYDATMANPYSYLTSLDLAGGLTFELGAGVTQTASLTTYIASINSILSSPPAAPGGVHIVDGPPTRATVNEYRKFTLPDTTPDPVPEPSTILLLGAGVAGLAGFGIRRRKQAASK